ncbi:tail fiber assembly protein [Pseudoalteromonas rubra]|uniref:tail fiber assembly protein n=1 Tax=Pseudoalteromonas rubra TaxID=43658 RepID=UPI000F7A63E0|nr:tail fiber assembly protein [Pseudoalteromonas rubra]
MQLVSVVYNDVSYQHWPISDLQDAGVPLSVIESAIESASIQEIRIARNALLAKTDWTQMPDAPLSTEQREAYAIYRQALRDVPQSYGIQGTVEWPQKPKL